MAFQTPNQKQVAFSDVYWVFDFTFVKLLNYTSSSG